MRDSDALNNHLFAQLEKLGNEDLEGDELKQEIERSKAMMGVTDKIIENAKIQLEANKVRHEYGIAHQEMPKLIGGQGEGKTH